jgi:YVTN family beta-propeller protein
MFYFSACATTQQSSTAARKANEGRFVLYFNGPAKTPIAISLEVEGIDAVREDGTSFPLLEQPLRLESLKVVERQLLLAETFLPRGRYRALRLRISRARFLTEGRETDLAVPSEGFLLTVHFDIAPREATPLFMTWDIERAIEREAFLRPAFGFEGRAKELRGVIAYVTNEGSDTLTVIDRTKDRAVDVIEVGSRPKGIVVSPDTSRAFLVNSGSHNLTILDVKDNRVLHTVNLDIGASASDLIVTPDGRTLYVANTALNTVSALDSESFQTLQTIPVGQRPVALVSDREGTRLFVADSASHTVSVIDTRRNEVTATIPVEFQPAWITLDPQGARAIVTHTASPQLAIISLTTFQVTRTVSVGIAASAIPDRAGGRFFVAIAPENRVALFDVNLNAELESVEVGASPHRLALDIDRGKLYAVNRGSDSVTVVDRTSRRVKAIIPVGKRPYAIAIVQ